MYLHGRLTTLTLEVEYKDASQGRKDQLEELPKWAFRLANLKSVAVNGKDLRSGSAMPGGPGRRVSSTNDPNLARANARRDPPGGSVRFYGSVSLR